MPKSKAQNCRLPSAEELPLAVKALTAMGGSHALGGLTWRWTHGMAYFICYTDKFRDYITSVHATPCLGSYPRLNIPDPNGRHGFKERKERMIRFLIQVHKAKTGLGQELSMLVTTTRPLVVTENP